MKNWSSFEADPFGLLSELDEEFASLDTEMVDTSQGEVSRRSPEYVRWVQRSLNQLMGLRLAVDGIISPMTRSAVRSFQARAGLKVDAIVGPQTERALVSAGASPPPSTPAVAPPARARTTDFIVRGGGLVPPPQLSVRNFLDPSVYRFQGSNRQARTISEFIVHESVTTSIAATVSALRNQSYGVHLILGPAGEITQHGDLADVHLSHAGTHNTFSVGVEVVNPYYPAYLQPGSPWTQIVPAGWAHGGRYVVPTPAQAEAVAQLTDWITSLAAVGLAIPRRWIGLFTNTAGDRLAMGRVAGAERSRPGIYAHAYFAHADGTWLVLYSYLRLEVGLDPEDAYGEAVRLATTSANSVPLP